VTALVKYDSACLAEAIDRVAETIVDEAKGDPFEALILWRALASDLHDLVKQKAEARRRLDGSTP
jgi:hypothetical protein